MTSPLQVYRVITIRHDGMRLPHGGRMRSIYRARLTARLLAMKNRDSRVESFAVSDGKKLVFQTPAAGDIE